MISGRLAIEETDMTRTIGVAFPVLLLAGCASDGPIGEPPVTASGKPAQVRVYRDHSGADMSAMTFWIDHEELYRLGKGHEFSFPLSPGSYLFGYSMGLHSCEAPVDIEPRGDYTFRLASGCVIELE
jgi:hypothetical protein